MLVFDSFKRKTQRSFIFSERKIKTFFCIIANKTQEIFIFLPCKKYLTPLFQGTKLGEPPFYVRSWNGPSPSLVRSHI